MKAGGRGRETLGHRASGHQKIKTLKHRGKEEEEVEETRNCDRSGSSPCLRASVVRLGSAALARFFHRRQGDIPAFNHLFGDFKLLHAFLAGQVIHQVKHQLFQDAEIHR